ncbi:hypothetical protein, partial [Mesorhizobium sp. M2D.F.Ca.ET.223.01.1.1]|uniref:hypothetical protein n=1 Tax=Mesorhizobium sp. M2D.F.Ca.ET.223.01.1.1 TaxID=2563940 RepID=UPI001AEEA40D
VSEKRFSFGLKLPCIAGAGSAFDRITDLPQNIRLCAISNGNVGPHFLEVDFRLHDCAQKGR